MLHNSNADAGALEADDGELFDYHAAASTSQQQKMSLSDLEAKWKDVPDKYFIIIAHFLSGHINDSESIDRFNGPILKASIKSVYWIFLIQYAALAMLGVLMNVAIIAYIMYHRLYKDVTHAFIINLALCHFVQCALVLPITLMVMLIQNWIFGQFLCFFLPMLQDIPLHVAMITHILIAWDRMRWLGDPLRMRLPAFVCCCATWLTGMVIALPYPIYTMYVEIGDYVPRLSGMGLCVINLMDDMHEYVRGLFLIMYCAPTILLAYLYIRTSQELRPPDGPFGVMMYEHRADMRNRQRNSSASSVDRSLSGSRAGGVGGGNLTTATTTGFGSGLTTITTHTNAGGGGGAGGVGGGGLAALANRSYDLYSAELDVYREKRNQRNFGSMAASQVVCLCPLMVLRFARLSMVETYENQKHFDFTYLMFVWIAFLPTVIFPCIYASQILPRTEQERLRGYFRLSSRRLKKSRNAADGAGGGKGEGNGGAGQNSHSSNSREASIEKDENTNTTLATSIIPGSEGYMSGVCSCEATATVTTPSASHTDPLKAGGTGKYKHHINCNGRQASMTADKKSAAGTGDKKSLPAVAGGKHLGKDVRIKKNDAKINILAEGSTGGGPTRAALKAVARGQRKLTIDSLDNSCSNLTSSTFCNGNSSLADDGGVSNFGDGEDSSIVSGMIVQNNGNTVAYYDKKWAGLTAPGLRQKDISFSDCSTTYSRRESSSTLERDMEIIDLLERERSMDIQEMIEREQHGETIRLAAGGGERRRLPDIEKIYQRSPKLKLDPYSFDMSTSATATTASTASAKDTQSTHSTTVSLRSDPLQSHNEAYSAATTLNEDELALARKAQLRDRSTDTEHTSAGLDEDEEVPQDFFDKYTPGGENTMPTGKGSGTAGVYQYQYTRRLSRKSSHHSQGSMGSHRNSKRDSFNSLNGTDLIAGAFGELDPTQPLTKMSVIENRMRRNSGRNSSFSTTSARSSLKSRDYSHGSTHSPHPELDFRENIFAEL